MKKVLRFLVVAMLFAMTGASFEIAAAKKSCSGRVKSNCTGSCEWRNKKCRHKVNNRSNAAASNTSASTASQVVDSEDSDAVDTGVNSSQDAVFQKLTPEDAHQFQSLPGCTIYGCNPSIPADAGSSNPQAITYQIFTPDNQFAGQGLVGYYYKDSQTVKIFDPTGANSQVYSFNDVVNMKTANVRPINLTYIGRFKTPGWVQPMVYCSGCPDGTNNLYGNIVPRND